MSKYSPVYQDIMSSHYLQSFRMWAESMDVTIAHARPVFMEYAYAIYNEVWGTSFMKHMPRFGYTKDLSELSGGNALRNGYATGVLFAFLIILLPFVFWSIVLLIFKMLGASSSSQKNNNNSSITSLFGGWIAGQPMVCHERLGSSTQRHFHMKVILVRLGFIIASCLLPVFALLIVYKGFHNLQSSTYTFDQSNDNVELIIDGALDIADTLDKVLRRVEATTQQNEFFGLRDNDESICPLVQFDPNANNVGVVLGSGLQQYINDYGADQLGSNIIDHFINNNNNVPTNNNGGGGGGGGSGVTINFANQQNENGGAVDNIQEDVQGFLDQVLFGGGFGRRELQNNNIDQEDGDDSTRSYKESEGVIRVDYQKILQNANNLVLVMEEIVVFSQTSAQEKLDRVTEGLWSAKDYTQDFSSVIAKVDKTSWVWPIVPIPLVIIPLIMAIATLLAHCNVTKNNEKFLCTLSYGFLPVLILWIILAYVFCAISAVLATSNADFCSGSGHASVLAPTPDSSVLLALDRRVAAQETTLSSAFAYDTIQYYVHQCLEEKFPVDPFLFLREIDVRIDAAALMLAKVVDLTNRVELAELSLVCGRDLVVPIYDLLENVQEILLLLKQSSTNTLDLLSCERIVPIYTHTIYDGVCDEFITGLSWIYISLVGISISGMLMITLRSAYQPVDEHDKPPLEKQLPIKKNKKPTKLRPVLDREKPLAKIKAPTKLRPILDREKPLCRNDIYGEKKQKLKTTDKQNNSNNNSSDIDVPPMMYRPRRSRSMDLEIGFMNSNSSTREESSSLNVVQSTYFQKRHSMDFHKRHSMGSSTVDDTVMGYSSSTEEERPTSNQDMIHKTSRRKSSLSLGSSAADNSSVVDDESTTTSKKKKKKSKSKKKSSDDSSKKSSKKKSSKKEKKSDDADGSSSKKKKSKKDKSSSKDDNNDDTKSSSSKKRKSKKEKKSETDDKKTAKKQKSKKEKSGDTEKKKKRKSKKKE